MKDWMTYEKIQELKRNHLKKSQVSRRLNIDYKTVTKYWDMPPDEFLAARNRTQRFSQSVQKCLFLRWRTTGHLAAFFEILLQKYGYDKI